MASVREILYVESERVGATIYRRRGESCEAIRIDKADARPQLETIGLDTPIAAVYRGVPGQ